MLDPVARPPRRRAELHAARRSALDRPRPSRAQSGRAPRREHAPGGRDVHAEPPRADAAAPA